MLMATQLIGFGAGQAAAAASWQTIFNPTLNSDAYSGYYTYTFRQLLLPALFSPAVSGTMVRVTFQSGTIQALTMTDAFIGQQASSGDPYDFATTPTRLTFNTGGTGFSSISGGATKVSDDVTFTFDATKAHIISMDVGDTAGQGTLRTLVSLANATVYDKIANDASTVDATGYSSDATGNVCGISKIEVFG